MNVAELKKRILRGFAQPELFWIPVKKKEETKTGSVTIGTRIPYYNVDTEEFDTSWQYWAWWNTQIVVKDMSGKIVYLTKKGYSYASQPINNIPYGKYKIKVIWAQYGGVVLDNEWHEFVLNDETNNSVVYVDLFYNVYKCTAVPNRTKLSPSYTERLDVDYDHRTRREGDSFFVLETTEIETLYTYHIYENNRLIQDFGIQNPNGSICYPLPIKGNTFCIYDLFSSVSGETVSGKICLGGYHGGYSSVSVNYKLLDVIDASKKISGLQRLYDPTNGTEPGVIGEVYKGSIDELPEEYHDVPSVSTVIVTEKESCSGYNGFTKIPICLVIISAVTGADPSRTPNFDKACSINTHLGEGIYGGSMGDMLPSLWLHDFMAFEDVLKLPPEEWNNENLSGYRGTLFYTVNYSRSAGDPYPRSRWISNSSGHSKTIYTKHIPDYTNTYFYALMQSAVKRGASKSNYYHNSNFYWIHNGQAWWSRDNPPYFYRNTNDLYQPGSTYEQYQMVGPPVWSDDYDDYY